MSSMMRSSRLATGLDAPLSNSHPYLRQVSDVYDFDLSEVEIQDVQYMNHIHQGFYENKFHRHLSSTIALHGVKVI